jgi:serralysin
MAVGVSGALSGNTFIDAILAGGARWSSGSSPVSVSYALVDGSAAWTVDQKAAFASALQTWSNVANVTFTSTAAAGANLVETMKSSADMGNSLATHNEPTAGATSTQGTYNSGAMTAGGIAQGGYDYVTFLHEIGHGLGLNYSHSSTDGSPAFPGVTAATGSYGDNNLNQGIFTTMSLNDGWAASQSPAGEGLTSYGYQGTPMAFDVAAVQHLYGANTSFNTGDDTYVLPDTNATGTFWSCIWDAGGTDTIVYQGAKAIFISL